MTVGILHLRLAVPAAGSLKAKRSVIKSLKDRVAGKFNVSIAEVGDQDKWQSAWLGVAAVGTDTPFVQSVLDHVINFIESEPRIMLVDCRSSLTHVGTE